MITVKVYASPIFKAFYKKVQGLGKRRKDLVANLQEEALFLVREGFKRQKDPYGKKWPGKIFDNGKPVLSGRTAALRTGWTRGKSTAREFSLRNATEYAEYHQFGTGIYGPSGQPIEPVNADMLAWQYGGRWYYAQSVDGVPPRKMVPDETGGMPDDWAEALSDMAAEWLEAELDV